jgi:selenocysteine lyase/cysteine desulfurase
VLALQVLRPHLGIAAIRSDLAETLPADRVRPASQTPAATASRPARSPSRRWPLHAAVGYLRSLGAATSTPPTPRSAATRRRSRAGALERLGGLEGVTVHGPQTVADRTPTFCLTVDGWAPRAVTERLARDGIFCWDGDFYAPGRCARSAWPAAPCAPASCTTRRSARWTGSWRRSARWVEGRAQRRLIASRGE